MVRRVLALGLLAVTVAMGQTSSRPASTGVSGRAPFDMGSPRVFLLDGRSLLEVKRRLPAGDPSLRPAFDRLGRDAKEALEFKPVSVMDKSVVPPSGDKHDYMSQGSYWWPDPAKPDGKPYIRRDGHYNPEGDKFDHKALGRMCSTVDTLSLAYFFTGERRYADHAARLLRTWFLAPATRMNPHLKYGQSIPGICEGRAIGIIDTAVLSRLVDSVGLLEDAAAWTEGDQQALQVWFRQYLTWLLESELGREEARQPNNHGTYYDVQVAAFALFTGQRDIAHRVLSESPARRIASQIEPDGRQPLELARTKAFGYSMANLRGMLDLARLGEHVGIDLWTYRTDDGRSIRKACDYLFQFADSDNKWPYKDLQGARPAALLPLLRRAAVGFREDRYEQIIHRLPKPETADNGVHLLYPSLDHRSQGGTRQ